MQHPRLNVKHNSRLNSNCNLITYLTGTLVTEATDHLAILEEEMDDENVTVYENTKASAVKSPSFEKLNQAVIHQAVRFGKPNHAVIIQGFSYEKPNQVFSYQAPRYEKSNQSVGNQDLRYEKPDQTVIYQPLCFEKPGQTIGNQDLSYEKSNKADGNQESPYEFGNQASTTFCTADDSDRKRKVSINLPCVIPGNGRSFTQICSRLGISWQLGVIIFINFVIGISSLFTVLSKMSGKSNLPRFCEQASKFQILHI